MALSEKEKGKKPFDSFKISSIFEEGQSERGAGDYPENERTHTMETKRRAADLFMRASFLLCDEAVKIGRLETIPMEEMDKVFDELEASAPFMKQRQPA
jgi:hypothetical protein